MTEKPVRPSSRWQVGFFVFSVFCYWMALYLYVPTLPLYARRFSDDLGTVGVVLSMYGFWQALTRFPVGMATDRLGRSKPIIFLGFGLTALGAWLLGMAPNIFWLGVGRAVTGLAAATWVPIVVVFCRFFPRSQTIRASAILTMGGAVARIVSTSTTGFLNAQGGYELAFYIAAVTAIVSCFSLFLAPADPKRIYRPALVPLRALVLRPQVLFPSLLNAMAQFINFALTFGFMPILASNLGANDIQVSLLITINMTLNLLGNATTAAMAHKMGPRNLLRAEFLLLGVGALLAGLAPRIWWLFLAQACIGMAIGIGYPALLGLSIRDVSEQERTTAMGLHQAVYGVGMFSGPFVTGFLANWLGIGPTFLVLSAFSLLMLYPRLWGRILIVATTEP